MFPQFHPNPPRPFVKPINILWSHNYLNYKPWLLPREWSEVAHSLVSPCSAIHHARRLQIEIPGFRTQCSCTWVCELIFLKEPVFKAYPSRIMQGVHSCTVYSKLSKLCLACFMLIDWLPIIPWLSACIGQSGGSTSHHPHRASYSAVPLSLTHSTSSIQGVGLALVWGFNWKEVQVPPVKVRNS